MPKAEKPNVIQYSKGNGEEMIIRLLSGIKDQLVEMNYYLAKQAGEEQPDTTKDQE